MGRGQIVKLLLAALVFTTPAAAQEISCVRCHSNQKTQFTGSAHAQAGLTCIDCHGGDPQATDESAHVADNFKRPDNKKAIAELCASCHSDVRKMNQYGLPTDRKSVV